ncbi:unnamed protein product [Bubo scandiacus]
MPCPAGRAPRRPQAAGRDGPGRAGPGGEGRESLAVRQEGSSGSPGGACSPSEIPFVLIFFQGQNRICYHLTRRQWYPDLRSLRIWMAHHLLVSFLWCTGHTHVKSSGTELSTLIGEEEIPSLIVHQKGDNTLIFEARFESGNLQKMVKVNEFEYELTLCTNLYTSRHTQWYYFQVNNMQAGMPYRFTIVNFTKHNSLYKCGLRPLLYSETDAKKYKVGWRRTGDEIKYYKNNVGQGRRQYFSLTWTFQFPHDEDT